MTPEVTKLVETFLAVTGTCEYHHINTRHALATMVPDEIRSTELRWVCVTCGEAHLDEVATHQLSLTATWDMLCLPSGG